MSRAPVILCVGRLYCDLIFTDLPRLPTLGTETFAGGFSVHAGGGAFITAAHLRSLGMAAGLAAFLPAATFREMLSCDLRSADIDTRFCADSAEDVDPQVTVALAAENDRAFVTRRAGPAIPPLEAQALQEARVTHLHVGELTTLLEQPSLIELARGIGCTISLDCGWDDDLDHDLAQQLIPEVDLFFPNVEELKFLKDNGFDEATAPLIAIKKGAEGAEVRHGETVLRAPADPVETVDTTGAGDAFNAGFLSRWTQGARLEDCLASGNRQGRLAVSRPGGFSPSGSDDIAMRLHGE